MQKPNNYDNTSDGSFTPINLGGHYLVIKKLEETKSKKGMPMIKVAFDFAAPDAQEGYFMKAFKDDVRPDKKWPHGGTQYILSEDSEGKCSRNFKRFMNAVEKSNNGFAVQWGDNFGEQFKGKKLGGVFGIVENEYNGKVTKRHEMRWVCEWSAVADAKVPDPKLLDTGSVREYPDPAASGFVNVPEDSGEEIPF